MKEVWSWGVLLGWKWTYITESVEARSTFHLLLFSHQVISDSLQPQGLQHARPPYPSPSPRVCPSSCTLNQWCHPTISSSVTLLSLCLRSFPIPGSFSMSQLFQWALSTRVKEIIWDIGSSGKYQQNEKAVNSATRPKCAGIQNRSQYGQVVHVSFCHISKEKNEDYFYNNFKD